MACQTAWYSADLSQQQAQLPCQLPDDVNLGTGQYSYMQQQCSEGYCGRLCTSCQPGYGSTGRFSCSKCSSVGVSAVEYWLLLMLLVACNAVYVWAYMHEDLETWDKPEASQFLEATLTYAQLMSILGMLDVQWPAILHGFFQAMSWLTHLAPKVVAPDCLLMHANTSSKPLALLSTVVQLAIPLGILLLFCLYFFCLHCWRRRAQPRSLLFKQLKVSTYAVLGFFYTSLTQAALSIMSCYPIDASAPAHTPYPDNLQATWHLGYWSNDMDYVCFRGRHLALSLGLGIPSLLAFGVGIPALFAYMVWRHRQALDDVHIRDKLGFAYRSYKLLFWWEGSALQLRQLGLLLVVVVGRPLGNYIQSLIVLALLTAELLYESLLKPQRFPHVQLMQATSVCLLVYSTMTILLFADYDNQASRVDLQLWVPLLVLPMC